MRLPTTTSTPIKGIHEAPKDIRDMPQGYIRTLTGRMVCPFNLSVDDLCIEDIAGAYARINRWGGHTPHVITLANHCYHVSLATEGSALWRLWGLLHDAAEVYIGDMMGPVKHFFPDFRELEDDILEVVRQWAGIPDDPAMFEEVSRADHVCCIYEWNHQHGLYWLANEGHTVQAETDEVISRFHFLALEARKEVGSCRK